MVSTESQTTATPCSPHAQQWTTGLWAQDPCPATPKRPQQSPRLAHQEWGPAPCSLATSVWGAQGRTSFRAPVGQEGGHRSTCRPHAPPHRASHDKAHRWGPGEQALAGPVCCAQGQGSLGGHPSKVWGLHKRWRQCGLPSLGFIEPCLCLGPRSNAPEGQVPSDVRSWCLGAQPAEASRSVGGIALLACTCTHLAAVRGNVEGADPACHSASPAGAQQDGGRAAAPP